MECAPLVARAARALARAQREKVFGRARHDVGFDLEDDAADEATADLNVHESSRVAWVRRAERMGIARLRVLVGGDSLRAKVSVRCTQHAVRLGEPGEPTQTDRTLPSHARPPAVWSVDCEVRDDCHRHQE
eukprot:3858331-Prymnesium_polylepis.1